jgi:hypothetical protein
MSDYKPCLDHLMEGDWDEGFHCTLPEGHAGAHKCEHQAAPEVLQEYNLGTDPQGRRYAWSHEWEYVSPAPRNG